MWIDDIYPEPHWAAESPDGDLATPQKLDKAVVAFERGNPVLLHDASERENETDLVYPAGTVTPTAVAHLRNDAGGLICVALSSGIAESTEQSLEDIREGATNTYIDFFRDQLGFVDGMKRDVAMDDDDVTLEYLR